MNDLTFTYLLISTLLWVLGFLHTGRFVRPKWKIPGKLLFYVGMSTLLAYWIGHFALAFIILHPLIGLVFHIRVCQKHQINWRTCQPRNQYLQLQEKWARGDFS